MHDGIQTTLYYFNPNIHPEAEWATRLENLKIVSDNKKVGLVVTDYQPVSYNEAIDNATRDPRFRKDDNVYRCPVCYRLRLEKTAKYAKENGYDAFSTTLFVSPYQQHDVLRKVAEEVSKEVGIDFYYTDWRPYFREGQNEARQLNLYRQRYCGCKYSLAESAKA